jgi:hypothetical protein
MCRRHQFLIPMAVLSALMLAGCAAEAVDAGSPTADDAPTSEAKPAPEVSHKTIRVKERIPFSQETIKTSSLDKGEVVLDQAGERGVRVRVVRLTLKNGVEAGRDVINAFVKRPPVSQVKLVGTHVEAEPKAPASSCDSNYAGACVPVASDVDCAGGSGDGPAYVQGPVTVVGSDVYDLNRDDDNIACD